MPNIPDTIFKSQIYDSDVKKMFLNSKIARILIFLHSKIFYQELNL